MLECVSCCREKVTRDKGNCGGIDYCGQRGVDNKNVPRKPAINAMGIGLLPVDELLSISVEVEKIRLEVWRKHIIFSLRELYFSRKVDDATTATGLMTDLEKNDGVVLLLRACVANPRKAITDLHDNIVKLNTIDTTTAKKFFNVRFCF